VAEHYIRPDLYFEMFYTYILRSKINNSYYVGSCKDLFVRLDEHNNGLVRSTKRYLPWELVYKEEFNNLSDARKRELKLKNWKRRSSLEKLVENISK